MAVIIRGNTTSTPTVIGDITSVNTGTIVSTLPITTPVTIIGDGSNADSYWNLSGTTLYPENLGYYVGLGTVAAGDVTDQVLVYDSTDRQIRYLAGSTFEKVGHVQAWSTITGTPTSLAGYNIADQLQPLDADLTAIAALGFASTSFLKKTAANTWALDTNTYSVSSHTHAYEPAIGNPVVDDYVLSSKVDGTRAWVAQASGGVGGVTDHGALTGLGDNDHSQYALVAAPVFTSSFGFASSNWRIVANGNHMDLRFNSVTIATLEDDGTFTVDGAINCTGDITAYTV
jgi:hypothetical protein